MSASAEIDCLAIVQLENFGYTPPAIPTKDSISSVLVGLGCDLSGLTYRTKEERNWEHGARGRLIYDHVSAECKLKQAGKGRRMTNQR